MLIGMTVPNTGPLANCDAVVVIAEAAEAAGLDSVWVADHVIVPQVSSQDYPYSRQPGVSLAPSHAFLDPIVALAAISARTQRLLLCTGVYLLPLRHPLISAKMIASLDRLSGGRVRLGVGLGWIREEYTALSVDWNARGQMFDEAIDYLRELWRAPMPDFSGQFWHAEGFGFEPKPESGQVPLLIGGLNDAARRRAAKRGDGWHLIDVEPEEVAAFAASLAADCVEAGRNPGEVPISIYLSTLFTKDAVAPSNRAFPLMGTPEQVTQRLIAYRDAGVAHAALAVRNLSAVDAYLGFIDNTARHVLSEFRK